MATAANLPPAVAEKRPSGGSGAGRSPPPGTEAAKNREGRDQGIRAADRW